MQIKVKPYAYSPCTLEIFTINGQEADAEDFGHLDGYRSEYKSRTCICRHFIVEEDKKEEAMKKYHLTEEEYEEVCEELKEEYYIKGCNTCRNDYDFFRMRV